MPPAAVPTFRCLHGLFSFLRLPLSDGDPNRPPSLILTFSLLAAAFFPNCGGWNQQPRRCVTASCWTACAAGARLQASLNSSPTGSRRLCPSKGSVWRRADPDVYSQGEVEHFHVAFFFIHPQEKNDSRRKVRIQEKVEAKPELALAYLEYLFNHKATRDKVLALRERCLKRLHTALGGWRVRWTFACSNMCTSLVSTMSVSAVSALHSPERHHRRPQVSQRGDGTQRVCVSRPPRSSSAAQRELSRPGQPLSLAKALCAEGEEDPVTSVVSELSRFIGCSCLSHGCSIEDAKKIFLKIMFIFKIPTKSHQVLTPFKALVCDCLFPAVAGVPGLRGSRVPALP